MKVKDLTVKVEYQVGLGDLEIPQKVYEQLLLSNESGDKIELNTMKYPEAADWLNDNIKESDSMNWDCDIVDIT